MMRPFLTGFETLQKILFQRRTSKEGLINPDDPPKDVTEDQIGSGSTDPLLQIPTEISAVLTLKRGGTSGPAMPGAAITTSSTFRPAAAGNAKNSPSSGGSRTPLLLKRKRESIV